MELGKVAGLRIGALRSKRDIKQVVLANALGVTQPHMSRVEAGKSPASIKMIERASMFFGVDPGIFVTCPESPELPIMSGIIHARSVPINDRGRAISCPNCGSNKFPDGTKYCMRCSYPLYNFCSSPSRHINPPDASYCGTCGSQTLWGMPIEDVLSREKVLD